MGYTHNPGLIFVAANIVAIQSKNLGYVNNLIINHLKEIKFINILHYQIDG